MDSKTSYQEGVKLLRVFTDERFPNIMIMYRGGTTFHVLHWIGTEHRTIELTPDPSDELGYPFIGWDEEDVFLRDEHDGDTDVDEAFAHLAAAEWFDDHERFPCKSCHGECKEAQDLDRHAKGSYVNGVYCPDCSRELGKQLIRVKR